MVTKIDIKKLKENRTTAELIEFGMINLDKSSGPTSFTVSEFVKKSLDLRKTSHFGTLDPKVTGVLPVALNRACKLTGYFLGEDKEYIGIMRMHDDVALAKVRKAIKEKFIGKIVQMPPVKSRVKRQNRIREVYRFELLERSKKDILFIAEVQGGTYIRKLIDDLGKELGIGAHMLELRRVRAGIFKEETIVNLYDYEKAVEEYKKGDDKALREMIIPAEIVSQLFPVIIVRTEKVQKLMHGKPITVLDLAEKPEAKEGDVVVAFSEEKKFVGMFKILNTEYVYAKSEFVFQPLK